jgi:hypothetical protein
VSIAGRETVAIYLCSELLPPEAQKRFFINFVGKMNLVRVKYPEPDV